MLALAVAIALWLSAGLILAINRLPLVPGILELIGIGYTGHSHLLQHIVIPLQHLVSFGLNLVSRAFEFQVCKHVT
ncbi:protein CURVATURE THYLAKOID 1B, chloroplastic-like [Magnolia sinica]|uniref:protein CURVATURE THYLAKOID 1B, chloroplastic-like n=1 Tax=Magnolia sinica TaxID=86752 RepID=UPI0026581ACF|nr:protein CURVATURE THYLAKOID 1B, chloroplastic-like [Magnolia sinica]